jgi:hypothetical protein
MENDAGNLRLAVAALQFLNHFACICAEDLYDVPTLRSGSYKSTVWVHGKCSYFCIVRCYYKINTFIDN